MPLIETHNMTNLWRIPLFGSAVFAAWQWDARRKLSWIENWIAPDQTLLEVGSGPGSVLSVFRKAGYKIDGIDIRDSSFRKDLKPTLYDGAQMPLTDRSVDAALLLTMLHHTPEPDLILREAMRVAKRLIIIEDVYETPFQRKYTKLADKITNLEFFGHPHTNRDDLEWRATFEKFGWTLRYAKVHSLAGIFQQAVYVVEPS